MYRLEKQLKELGYELIDTYYHEYYQKHIVDGICLKAEKYENRKGKFYMSIYIDLPATIRITTQQQIDNIQKAYDQLQIDQAIVNKWREELDGTSGL